MATIGWQPQFHDVRMGPQCEPGIYSNNLPRSVSA